MDTPPGKQVRHNRLEGRRTKVCISQAGTVEKIRGKHNLNELTLTNTVKVAFEKGFETTRQGLQQLVCID